MTDNRLTQNQKAARVSASLAKLSTEYAQEGKPHTATRCETVRIELTANPEVAARLYDLLIEEGVR